MRCEGEWAWYLRDGVRTTQPRAKEDGLVVGEGNTDLVVACGVEDAEGLGHLNEIGGVVEV